MLENMLYKMYSKCNYFENVCTTYLGLQKKRCVPWNIYTVWSSWIFIKFVLKLEYQFMDVSY